LIHGLTERGVGVRNLADPIKVDSAESADPMGQLAVVLLAFFAQMERTYICERAAHARTRWTPRSACSPNRSAAQTRARPPALVSGVPDLPGRPW